MAVVIVARKAVCVVAVISSRQMSSEMHQAAVYFVMKEEYGEAWTSVAIRREHEFGPESRSGSGGWFQRPNGPMMTLFSN